MRNRALLVGVSDTAWESGRFPRLSGVPSDLKRMRELLAARGYVVSEPPDLNAESVKATLINIVSTTGRGDTTVLYLTGHGYQVRDRSGDEIDGWDEAFVCADVPILDDWFRDNLWPLAIEGARFVSIVDACHSDTVTQGLWTPELDPPTTMGGASRGYYRLTLAASRDYEKTLDLGPNDDGGGIVTSALAKGLQNKRPTYRQLWTTIASDISVQYAGQGIGTPTYDSLGPDDSFLWAEAFTPQLILPHPRAGPRRLLSPRCASGGHGRTGAWKGRNRSAGS